MAFPFSKQTGRSGGFPPLRPFCRFSIIRIPLRRRDYCSAVFDRTPPFRDRKRKLSSSTHENAADFKWKMSFQKSRTKSVTEIFPNSARLEEAAEYNSFLFSGAIAMDAKVGPHSGRAARAIRSGPGLQNLLHDFDRTDACAPHDLPRTRRRVRGCREQYATPSKYVGRLD